MRLAVLSDIHANLAALDAVRDDLPEIDEVWVLGDIVGYGPQPNEVIARLQEMGARSVMGNHDGAAIGQVDIGWFNPDAARAIRWTAEVVDENARAYLAALPAVRREGELTAVHGSPRDPTWEYITDPAVAQANLASFDTRLCLHGHTHVPIVWRAEDGQVAAVPSAPGSPVSMSGGRLLANPGSVGQPRDGDPRAAWLELDTDTWEAAYHRVEYEIDRAAEAITANELPEHLARRLYVGQ
jgi:diadenosine tetraphosphatase ApaH/serine/threonine PP2A family protein phosphatase